MKAQILSISLPESMRIFVDEQAGYNYGSVSEYIRELIRNDQRRVCELTEGAAPERSSAVTSQRPKADRFPFRRN